MPDPSCDCHQTNQKSVEESASLPEQSLINAAGSPDPGANLEMNVISLAPEKPQRHLWADEKWIVLNKSIFERIFEDTFHEMCDMRSSSLPASGADTHNVSLRDTYTTLSCNVSSASVVGLSDTRTAKLGSNAQEAAPLNVPDITASNCTDRPPGDRPLGQIHSPTGKQDEAGGQESPDLAPGTPPSGSVPPPECTHTRCNSVNNESNNLVGRQKTDLVNRGEGGERVQQDARGAGTGLAQVTESHGGPIDTVAPQKSPKTNCKGHESETEYSIETSINHKTTFSRNEKFESHQAHHNEIIDEPPGTTSCVPNDLGGRCEKNYGHITSLTACGALAFIARPHKNCTHTTSSSDTGHSYAKTASTDLHSISDTAIIRLERMGGDELKEGEGGRDCSATGTHTLATTAEVAPRDSQCKMPGSCVLAASPPHGNLDIIASVCSTREKLTMPIAKSREVSHSQYSEVSRAGGRAEQLAMARDNNTARDPGNLSPPVSPTQPKVLKESEAKSLKLHSEPTLPNITSLVARNKSSKERRRKKNTSAGSALKQKWVALSKSVVFDMVDSAFTDTLESKSTPSLDLVIGPSRQVGCLRARSLTAASPMSRQAEADSNRPRSNDTSDSHLHGLHVEKDPILSNTNRPTVCRKNTSSAATFNADKPRVQTQDKTPQERTGAEVKSRLGTATSKPPKVNSSFPKNDTVGDLQPVSPLKAVIGGNSKLGTKLTRQPISKPPLPPISFPENTPFVEGGGQTSLNSHSNIQAPSAGDEDQKTTPSVLQVVAKHDNQELRSLLASNTLSLSSSLNDNSGLVNGKENNVQGNQNDALFNSDLLRDDLATTQVDQNVKTSLWKLLERRGQALDLSKHGNRKSIDSVESCDSDSRPVRGERVTDVTASVAGSAASDNKVNVGCLNKCMESPKPGWVALSKAEVHTIVDTVMSSMLGVDDTTDLENDNVMTDGVSSDRLSFGELTVPSVYQGPPCSRRGQTGDDNCGSQPTSMSTIADQTQPSPPTHQALSRMCANNSRQGQIFSLNSVLTTFSAADSISKGSLKESNEFIIKNSRSQRGEFTREHDNGQKTCPVSKPNSGCASRSSGAFKWKSNMLRRMQEHELEDVECEKPPHTATRPDLASGQSRDPAQLKSPIRGKRRHVNSQRNGIKSKRANVGLACV